MDVGLRLEMNPPANGIEGCFNPCFSGCWSATLPQLHIKYYNYWVSILVLVDVGLRQVAGDTSELKEICFNPCFSGCWSATLNILYEDEDGTKFQSLF